MANLIPNPSGPKDVFQWDTETPLLGGSSTAPMNLQAQALLNRIAELKVGSISVAPSIAALRNVDSANVSHVFVSGYYEPGDGGGGDYYFDADDTSSADDAGSVIVATNGARWKLHFTGSVHLKQFGAKGDGVTSDVAAIRRTFDFAAKGHGTFPNGFGCVVTGAGGVYYCPETIYIPRCNAPMKFDFSGAVFKGIAAGTGTIFESGRNTYSTGATSNWGAPEGFLHYNTLIEGGKFINCEYGLKLYNFLQGCVVERNVGQQCKTLLWMSRCFYAHVLNNSTLSAYYHEDADETWACFRFEDNVNTMRIEGNSSVRGRPSSEVPFKGSGYYLASGVSGSDLITNSAEQCDKGIVVKGAVYGLKIIGGFLENNNKDICIEDGNYKDGLDIDGVWLYSPIAIEAVAWRSGLLGMNMRYYNSGSVTISSSLGADGHLNSLHVWLPRLLRDETAHRTAVIVPANWSLAASVIVHRQMSTYIAANGPGDPRAMLAETTMGPSMMVPRHYAGNPNLKRFAASDGGMPFDVITNNTNPGPGSIVVDCPINWDVNEAGVIFFMTIAESGGSTSRICGVLMGTSVYRFDATAGKTVVASVNSGKLRLTVSSFTNADIAGGVFVLG